MATSQNKAAPTKKKVSTPKGSAKTATPPRASAGKKTAAPTAVEGNKKKAEVLLRAGINALGTVRDNVARRQTNVIEGLLGIKKSDTPRSFPNLDSFGIRKFEDVFDQRVATALQRLGIPTADEVEALRHEVAQLREQISLMKTPVASAIRRKR